MLQSRAESYEVEDGVGHSHTLDQEMQFEADIQQVQSFQDNCEISLDQLVMTNAV